MPGFFQVSITRYPGRIAEIAENAIDASAEKIPQFAGRITLVHASQIFRLVTERKAVDEQAGLVSVGDQARWRRLVDVGSRTGVRRAIGIGRFER